LSNSAGVVNTQNGNTNNIYFNDLCAGLYSFSISYDNITCESTLFNINNDTPPNIFIINSLPDPMDSTISISMIGDLPFSFNLLNLETGNSFDTTSVIPSFIIDIQFEEFGTYQITATDLDGCSTVDTIFVAYNCGLTLQDFEILSDNCSQTGVSFSITSFDMLPDYVVELNGDIIENEASNFYEINDLEGSNFNYLQVYFENTVLENEQRKQRKTNPIKDK